MEFHIIIPARFASQRLPGKVLLDVAGKPILQHVYERALASNPASVTIAADDQRVVDVAKQFSANVILTSTSHRSGTERISEVLEKGHFQDHDIIVNLQADEPLIPISIVRQAAYLLHDNPQADVATLSTDIISREELFDPNVVKVVCDCNGFALYFSRSVLPYARDHFNQQNQSLPANYKFQRHIGLYAQRAGFIKQYVNWPSSPIEQLESLEQLRVLWRGGKIIVDRALAVPPHGVDCEKDLAEVRAVIASLIEQEELVH